LKVAVAASEHLRQHVTAEDKSLADAKVALAEQQLAAANERLAKTELRAPCNGTVLEILRREGEAAGGQPVVLFGDLSRILVRAEIDERYAFDIKENQAVTVSGPNLRGRNFTGRVVQVKPLMGDKTVFARTAEERKDLDVMEVLIEMDEGFEVPIGLRVDVSVEVRRD
jgi:HlyD family secretion protein